MRRILLLLAAISSASPPSSEGYRQEDQAYGVVLSRHQHRQ
jgi:hypothetical protein